jgi:hypothetical protein
VRREFVLHADETGFSGQSTKHPAPRWRGRILSAFLAGVCQGRDGSDENSGSHEKISDRIRASKSSIIV